jgi:hydroxyacylglutathione hydrolase
MQEHLASAKVKVHIIPCLRDNYAWIVQDLSSGQLAVIDTPAAKPIIEKMNQLGVQEGTRPLILNTHHHRDHTGGNLAIKEQLGAVIVGPKNDHIIGIDRAVSEGDVVRVGQSSCRVIDLPGHTKGHIGYVFDEAGLVFVGDTLFSHGCGALFEGSFQQMWKSLTKIMQLPPNYLVFCAHEYTESNLHFARKLFPQDPEVLQVYNQVKDMRLRSEPTIPSLLEQELSTNPFLRCRLPEYQQQLGKSNAIEAFTAVRAWKDEFGRGSAI